MSASDIRRLLLLLKERGFFQFYLQPTGAVSLSKSRLFRKRYHERLENLKGMAAGRPSTDRKPHDLPTKGPASLADRYT